MKNTQIVIGHIGKEIKLLDFAAKGDKTASHLTEFQVASTTSYKDEEGNKKDSTEWFTCKMWNKPKAGAILKSGMKVYVEGPTIHSSYLKEVGSEKVTIPTSYIKVVELLFLENKETQAQEG